MSQTILFNGLNSFETLEGKLSPTSLSVGGIVATSVMSNLSPPQPDDDDPPPEPAPAPPPYPGDNPPIDDPLGPPSGPGGPGS